MLAHKECNFGVKIEVVLHELGYNDGATEMESTRFRPI